MKIYQANKDVVIHEQKHLTLKSYIHISSRRAVILMSSRYDQVKNLANYDIQEDSRLFTILAQVNLRIFSLIIEDLCTHEKE